MADEKPKGHCPKCAAERNAECVGEHEERWDDGHAQGAVRHSILKCLGCETVYVQRAESCSEHDHHYQDETGEWCVEYPETKTYWPAPSTRARPEWVHALAADPDLNNLHDELYAALNSDLRVLAAIGVRTTFDRASELLGVDPALPFARKLEELEKQGSIGGKEKESLAVLADAGSAAAHRGWRPTPDQLDTMVSTLEAFLHRTMVLGDALQKLKEAMPKRQKAEAARAKAAPEGG